MKKILLTVITLLFCLNANAASLYTQKTYDVETKDGHIIKAFLSYPKTKKKSYPTVVMLHSLGYSSRDWQNITETFNAQGCAVLMMDFRGHGKSVYDTKFRQKSWIYYKNDTFVKYPNDVIETINFVKKQTKKASFDNWIFVGADIGANTAILVAKDISPKPKALVLISASMSLKGIYTPIAMTEIGHTPILSIASKNDKNSINEQIKLSKFAQGHFDIYNVDKGGTGMLLLKANKQIEPFIIKWASTYLNLPSAE